MTRPPSSPILVEYLTLRVCNFAVTFQQHPETNALVICPNPSSASRFTAGASGFLNLSQSGDLPDQRRDPSRFETIPSSPILRACWNTRAPSEVLQEAQTKAAIARRSHTLSMISTFRSAISVVCHPQTYAPAHSSPRSSVSLGRWRHGKIPFLQREAGVRASWFVAGRW